MAVFDEKVNLQQIDTRTGAAQQFRSLGDRIGSFIAQQGAQAESMTQAIMNREDQKAQQAKKAALSTYEAQLDRDLREGLSRISAENPDDLITFNEKAGSFVDSYLGSIDGEYADQLQDKALGLLSSYRIGVQNNNINKDRSIASDELTAAAKVQSNDALRLMRVGDTLESAQAMLDFQKTQTDAIEAGFITEGEANENMTNLSKRVAEESFMSQLDAEEDLDNKMAMIEKWQDKFPTGWSPDEWSSFVNKARRDVASELSLRDSQRTAQNKVLKNQVKTAFEAIELGQDIPQAEIESLAFQVKDSADPEIQNLFSEGMMVIGFSRQSSMVQQAELAALEKSGLEDSKEYVVLTKAYERTQAEARRDGMGLAERQGLVEPNPLQTPDDFLMAGQQSLALSEHYGVAVSPFTDEQASQWSSLLPEMNFQQKIL